MQEDWQNKEEGTEDIQKQKITDQEKSSALPGLSSADDVVSDEKEGDSWLKYVDTRVVALFILGVLIGVTLKTHALKTVTMGFEDYKLADYKQEFNLSEENLEEVSQEEEVESVEIIGGDETESEKQ